MTNALNRCILHYSDFTNKVKMLLHWQQKHNDGPPLLSLCYLFFYLCYCCCCCCWYNSSGSRLQLDGHAECNTICPAESNNYFIFHIVFSIKRNHQAFMIRLTGLYINFNWADSVFIITSVLVIVKFRFNSIVSRLIEVNQRIRSGLDSLFHDLASSATFGIKRYRSGNKIRIDENWNRLILISIQLKKYSS